GVGQRDGEIAGAVLVDGGRRGGDDRLIGDRVDLERGRGGAERGAGGGVMGLYRNRDRDGALELAGRRDGEAVEVGGGMRGDGEAAAAIGDDAGAVHRCAIRQRHGHGAVFPSAPLFRSGVGQRDGEIAGAVLVDGGRRGGDDRLIGDRVDLERGRGG